LHGRELVAEGMFKKNGRCMASECVVESLPHLSHLTRGDSCDVLNGHIDSLSWPKPVFFELLLTERCNMNCAYCWEKNKSLVDMDENIIRKAIDFCLYASAEINKIDLFFFGGEPFLRFDLIKFIHEYATEQAQKMDKSISWSTTTNGTLLTEEIAAWCRDIGLKYLLSMDGSEEVHNKYRKYPDGTGSFSTVKNNIKYLKKYQPWLGARVTIMPENAERIVDDIWSLLDIGINQFIIGKAHGNVWTDEDSERYEKGMYRLCELYIALKKRKWPFRITSFEDSELSKSGHNSRGFGCGAGRGRLAIDPRGDIYGCGKLANITGVGNGVLPLGNIFQGYTRSKNRADLLDPTIKKRADCVGCVYIGRCSGGCPAVNASTGDSIFSSVENCKRDIEVYDRIIEYAKRRKKECGFEQD